MAALAADLVAEVSGTLTLLIVSTPFSLAVFTASLVVALSIAWLAAVWAALTCLCKPAFSSSVKFEPSIASFLVLAA